MTLSVLFNTYVLAWLIYLGCACGLQWVFARLSGRLVKHYGFRQLLRAIVAVILFTPVYSRLADNWLVPAWLYGGYETILGQGLDSARAFTGMAFAGCLMLIMWGLDLLRVRRSGGEGS